MDCVVCSKAPCKFIPDSTQSVVISRTKGNAFNILRFLKRALLRKTAIGQCTPKLAKTSVITQVIGQDNAKTHWNNHKAISTDNMAAKP